MCCLVGGGVRLGGSPEWSWGQVRWGHSDRGLGVRGRVQWACTATALGVSLTHVADLHLHSTSTHSSQVSVEIVS